MLSTRSMWRAAGAAGLLATLLFLFGFVYAVQDLVHPKGEEVARAPDRTPAPIAGKDGLQIVALGDSLTRGFGDETGDGYVGRLKKRLEQGGKSVFVYNNSRNGAKTNDLEALLKETYILESVKKADVVLLTIGGNDLNQYGLTGTKQPSGTTDVVPELNYAEIQKRLPEAAGRLDSILTTIHNLAPQSRIVYVGLYNPYMEEDPSGEGTKQLQDWNTRAFTVAARLKNITVVPSFDLFQNQGNRFLFMDHFHPNAEGYDRIAERVYQVLQ